MVGVMALLLKMREKNPTAMKNASESAEVLWVHLAGSKTTEGSERLSDGLHRAELQCNPQSFLQHLLSFHLFLTVHYLFPARFFAASLALLNSVVTKLCFQGPPIVVDQKSALV